MNLSKYVTQVKEQLLYKVKNKFPGTENLINSIPVVICSGDNAVSEYNKAVLECGSFSSGWSPYSMGELIYGLKGNKLLVYEDNIEDQRQLAQVLWHELGHVISNAFIPQIIEEKLAYFVDMVASGDEYYFEHFSPEEQRYQEMLAYGTMLWGEFAADTVFNLVNEDIPPATEYDVKMWLRNGILTTFQKCVYPDALGHYFAALLTSPIALPYINDKYECGIGYEDFSKDMYELMNNLMRLLKRQTTEENFCIITKENVLKIGEYVLALRDIYEAD